MVTPSGGPRERCPFFGHDPSGSSTPRSKAELLNDGILEEVQFTGEGARAEDPRLRLVAYLREPWSPESARPRLRPLM